MIEIISQISEIACSEVAAASIENISYMILIKIMF